jgi:TRAP transporter TAXI family solute receptor
MKNRYLYFLIFFVSTVVNQTANSERLTFMTGPAGGTWYPLGGAVKQLLEEEIENLQIVLRPGAGLINIKGISTGKAELAWGNVISTVDAIHGRPPFQKPIENLCNLAAFYYQYAQIPVRDVTLSSIADLRGKSVATLPRGNTTEVAARSILGLYDLVYDDLEKINFVSITDQVNMMKDGQVDAIMLATSVPAAGIIDLSSARDIKLLPISDEKFQLLNSRNPGWSRALIPAGTYPGQKDDIPTASFQMHMIADCSAVSKSTAYKIVEALSRRGKELSAVTAMLDGYDINVMSKYVGIPFHDGAKLFYAENGITLSH